jgi:hypothetical protein
MKTPRVENIVTVSLYVLAVDANFYYLHAMIYLQCLKTTGISTKKKGVSSFLEEQILKYCI